MINELDDLCLLLDEQGLEWREHEAPATDCIAFFDGNGWHDCWESVDGEVNVTFSMTPEQAIAATLGTGTCVPVLDSERDNQPYLKPRFVCSECGCQLTESRLGKVWQNYCPNCGRRIEQ